MRLKVASFDLDGTLVHPAIFNAVAEPLGFAEKLEETTRAYFEGRMTAEETFHADYKHFVGRRVDEMLAALRESKAWTPGIREAFAALHDAGLRVVVTTDQPDFLAGVTRELFGVDALACTPADVRHGRVAGTYDYRGDKWDNLRRLLRAWKVEPAEVSHVGNGSNDVPVFRNVGWSAAVFAMNGEVRRGATVDLGKPEDMREVAEALLRAAASP